MSIFSRKPNQYSEPEDLDSGYKNPYYTRSERRDDRRDDRFEDRAANRRDEDDLYENRRPVERAPRDEFEDDRRSLHSSVYEEEESARSYRDRGYDDEPVIRRRPEKAPEKPAAPVNKGTLYYTPENYRDLRSEIVNGVAECHVVVVNILNLESAELVRLLDYVMGAVQVLGATLRRWGTNNLLLIPKDVEINEEELVIPEDEDLEEDEESYEEYDEDYEDYDEE